MKAEQLQRGATAVAAVAMLAFANAAIPVASASESSADEAPVTGVRLQIDNDLFAAGGARDRDYTGGMGLTISGREARDGLLSLDPLLRKLDALTTPDAESSLVRHARQFGLMAFTPADISARQPLTNDRPYASLLFMSNARVRVDADNRNAWSSSLTIGALGLPMAANLHSEVHKVFGSEAPEGYDNQISAGGEPTARYTLARHHLWVANAARTFDVKTTVQGSVGYLTETSAALSVRAGRFDSPWWSFAPELTDYISAPMPVDAGTHARPERYGFAGIRVKARAYNAFLQGQFRDSAVHYAWSDIQPIVAEAWVGFVTQVFEQTELSYTINFQTPELRHGAGDRESLWAAIQFSHSF